MLYFLMVAHKAACHTLSNAFLKSISYMVEIFLVLQVLFAEDSKVEYLLCRTVSCSKAGLFFSDDILCLWLQSVKDDLQHEFSWVADEAYCPVVLIQL